MTILITGSMGLIGRHLLTELARAGFDCREFDLNRNSREDLRDPTAVATALAGVAGIVHLGAVSRVVWGQRDPKNCYKTNVLATRNLLSLCMSRAVRPWIIYASSREVYGQQPDGLVGEDATLQPMNAYANSKRDCELLCNEARSAGIRANIVRFSSVYGCALDHVDRVVPAYCRIAAFGGIARLEGPEHVLDFTHVRDVAQGLYRLVELTDSGDQLPPIHLVSGKGFSLRALAGLARGNARSSFSVCQAPPRSYDVSRFVGDPSRAHQLLGWKVQTNIEDGVRQLVSDIAASRMHAVTQTQI